MCICNSVLLVSLLLVSYIKHRSQINTYQTGARDVINVYYFYYGATHRRKHDIWHSNSVSASLTIYGTVSNRLHAPICFFGKGANARVCCTSE